LVALAAEIRREERQACAAFLTWWDGPDANQLRHNLHAIEFREQNVVRTDAVGEPVQAAEAAPVNGTVAVDANPTLPRIAAIDVGTNSIRLVIAEIASDKRLRTLDDERAVTRLGRGLARTRRLSARAMNESTDALRQFRAIAEGYRVDALRAVATCAVREARNGSDFVDMVKRKADLDLEIISPETEARLAFRSVSSAFDLHSTRSAAIDIGGGSTEIVLGYGTLIEQVFSLPIGAIRLTEKFRIADAVPDDRYRAMRKYISRMVERTVGRPMFIPHMAIGTGGTFTTLAAMSMMRGAHAKASEFLPFNVRGYELQRSELKHILDYLRGLSLNGRLQVPGLSAERAEIIVAGLTIIDVVLKHLEVNTLRVHDQGVRAGLLHTMADELLPHEPGPPPAIPTNRLHSVRQFAASCNYEKEHSEQVAKLSLMIFDQLSQALDAGAVHWATPENRELLHAGALLHDIGYFINYSQHHKHSYHMVMHSDLTGFTHRQREIIANLGRYHRGACAR
jgi:exopolyphosphatase / guanosine-5'-triphosphate,3'-diphosphate pyrophosphatase